MEEREKVHGEINHLGPRILIGQTSNRYRYYVYKIVSGYFIPYFAFCLNFKKQSLLSSRFLVHNFCWRE